MLIQDGPKGWFREMVSQLLKWGPSNHCWPTFETLENALQNSGRDNLAFKFWLIFVQKEGKGSG